MISEYLNFISMSWFNKVFQTFCELQTVCVTFTPCCKIRSSSSPISWELCLNPAIIFYQAGKSILDALHHFVRYVEKVIANKEIAFGLFVGIKGVSYTSTKTYRTFSNHSLVWGYTWKLHYNSLSEGAETSIIKTQGWPQVMLSHLLWSIVADDLVLLVRSKHDVVAFDPMQNALYCISKIIKGPLQEREKLVLGLRD